MTYHLLDRYTDELRANAVTRFHPLDRLLAGAFGLFNDIDGTYGKATRGAAAVISTLVLFISFTLVAMPEMLHAAPLSAELSIAAPALA